jgi:hypothetical protein
MTVLNDLVLGEPADDATAPTEEAPNPNRFTMPVMVLEGAWTGDMRKIDPGVLTWRDLPLPVMAITRTTMGHEDAELVGKLTSIERKDANEQGLTDSRTGEPYPAGTSYLAAEGEFDTAEFAGEVKRLVSDGFLRGVSVDLGDVESELVIVDDDGNESEVDFWDWLFGDGEDEGKLGEKLTAGRVMGVTICPFPAFEGAYIEIPDGDGVLVSDGTSRDSNDFGPSVINMDKPFARKGALLASGGPAVPPAEWFDNPGLTGPTAMTIDADGRIFGHLATWRECHTGYSGQCVRAPRNVTEYAYFRTGAVMCDGDELVNTGPITIDTGHADMGLAAMPAKAHYDDTGSAVADIAVGDDAYGIWYAGAIRPDVTPTVLRTLRASALSGDWRQIGGRLELVAALACNVPGFPVVRPHARVASGMPQSLVAAGMITDKVVSKLAAASGQQPSAQDGPAPSAGLSENAERVVKQALRDRVNQPD